MKKIIHGKVYNTETAQEMAYASHGGRTSFEFYEETLYRKKTGEFFLHGSGHAASKYAKMCGLNEWSGSDEIIPLTYEKAQMWAEKEVDADTYEEIFGEVVEDDSRKVLTVNLAVSTIDAAKRLASQRATSLSALVEELLLAEINK